MKYFSRHVTAILAAANLCCTEAFSPSTFPSPYVRVANGQFGRSKHMLCMSIETLPDVSSMRVGELKKELESYGISTRSFLEKSELADAVEKARAEGKTPISNVSDKTSSSSSNDSDKSRDEKLKEEIEKCQNMRAGELKKELESYGISTSSFFEKSEFVKACAEARVDGKNKASSSSSSGEGYAEYADVEVLTSEDAGPRKRSTSQEEQVGGGNPFGGGMPGGMGGMGGIGDILKNMGNGGMGGGASPFGGGGGGGNPFAGTGGNPFGGGAGGSDPMKKAQEMMSNPKVMEIMAKAQSNPKIMKAMQECMSNPMAFSKYQNDPEVGELMRELQKYM